MERCFFILNIVILNINGSLTFEVLTSLSLYLLLYSLRKNPHAMPGDLHKQVCSHFEVNLSKSRSADRILSI